MKSFLSTFLAILAAAAVIGLITFMVNLHNEGEAQREAMERVAGPDAPPRTFEEDVAHCKAAALTKYPDIGVQGSVLNVRYVTRYNQWVAAHDARLKQSNWPKKLADDCAKNP